MNNKFDLLVMGGGHAGVEAALVGCRFGLSVALVTLDKLKVGRMSCNPAIGGIGKSHLAKEVDALGGYMCEATDLSGIQFKTLNKKKVRRFRQQEHKQTKIFMKKRFKRKYQKPICKYLMMKL